MKRDVDGTVVALETEADLREALACLAAEIVASKQRLMEATATLSQLGDLVRAMDERIKLLTKLLDRHEHRLARLEGVSPEGRPN